MADNVHILKRNMSSEQARAMFEGYGKLIIYLDYIASEEPDVMIEEYNASEDARRILDILFTSGAIDAHMLLVISAEYQPKRIPDNSEGTA